jgi:hypothetical protein
MKHQDSIFASLLRVLRDVRQDCVEAEQACVYRSRN